MSKKIAHPTETVVMDEIAAFEDPQVAASMEATLQQIAERKAREEG